MKHDDVGMTNSRKSKIRSNSPRLYPFLCCRYHPKAPGTLLMYSQHLALGSREQVEDTHLRFALVSRESFSFRALDLTFNPMMGPHESIDAQPDLSRD